MRFARFDLIVACILLSACSGGDKIVTPHIPLATPTPTVAPTMTPSPVAYAGSIVATSEIYPSTNVATPQPLLLGGGLFARPFIKFATATLAVQPAPASSPNVTWKSSNGNISLVYDPNSLGAPAPAGGTAISVVNFGASTLTATAAAPYNITATLPVFSYPSTEIGCDFRAYAGQAFDPGASGPISPATADMYATGAPSPQDGLNPCNAAGFKTAAGSPVVFHFPYGATLATNGDDATESVAPGVQRAPLFPYAPATLWRNDFTSIDQSTIAAKAGPCGNAAKCGTLGGTVIFFKTKGGRIVKFDIFSPVSPNNTVLFGLVEVSSLGAKFAY